VVAGLDADAGAIGDERDDPRFARETWDLSVHSTSWGPDEGDLSRAPNAQEVESRLRQASRLSDLKAESRLEAKIDLSPEGVRRRLQEASDLLDTSRKLAELRQG
jgi:hypothetical protein